MNNIFNLFGGIQNFQNQFNLFKQNMSQQNMDPKQKVQELLNSGKMTQQQFEQLRQIANRITGKNM